MRNGADAFVLNSDTVVHEGALLTLLEYSRANPEVGIIGPKILNPDGSLQLSCRRFPNPITAIFRDTFIGALFPNSRVIREYLMLDWSHDEARSVDWVSGAALYVTKSAMDKIGFLDEGYFMHCEDIDWCFRAHQANFDVRYLPTPVITHAMGSSSKKAANRVIIFLHRSILRFYRKNVLPTQPVILRPFAVAFAAAALFARASIFITRNNLGSLVRKARAVFSGA
jgi:hypothetical protein